MTRLPADRPLVCDFQLLTDPGDGRLSRVPAVLAISGGQQPEIRIVTDHGVALAAPASQVAYLRVSPALVALVAGGREWHLDARAGDLPLTPEQRDLMSRGRLYRPQRGWRPALGVFGWVISVLLFPLAVLSFFTGDAIPWDIPSGSDLPGGAWRKVLRRAGAASISAQAPRP